MRIVQCAFATIMASASLFLPFAPALAIDGGFFSDPTVLESLGPWDLSVIDLSNNQRPVYPGSFVTGPWRPVDPTVRKISFPRIKPGTIVGWSKVMSWPSSDFRTTYDVHWTPTFGEDFVIISPIFSKGVRMSSHGPHGIACVLEPGSRAAIMARDGVRSNGFEVPEKDVALVVEVTAGSTLIADPGCPVGFKGVISEDQARLYLGLSSDIRWFMAESYTYAFMRSTEGMIRRVNSAFAFQGWPERASYKAHDGSDLYGTVFDIPWD